jgi:hypothetical protein
VDDRNFRIAVRAGNLPPLAPRSEITAALRLHVRPLRDALPLENARHVFADCAARDVERRGYLGVALALLNEFGYFALAGCEFGGEFAAKAHDFGGGPPARCLIEAAVLNSIRASTMDKIAFASSDHRPSNSDSTAKTLRIKSAQVASRDSGCSLSALTGSRDRP